MQTEEQWSDQTRRGVLSLLHGMLECEVRAAIVISILAGSVAFPLGSAYSSHEMSGTMRPLTVDTVMQAFAAEGIPFKQLAGTRQAPPITLIPANLPDFPLFAASVYGADAVARPLGLVITNVGHETVRIRNVVVSYAPESAVAAQVSAAIERLRNDDQLDRPPDD
jgi:hypothetical protein